MGESIKKAKSVKKNLFSEEVLKNWKKMITADAKADVKQQEIKELVAVFRIFYMK